jgi:hypothetical protein
MRVLVVFFILWISIACKKEKCYDCIQKIEKTCNKKVIGYPYKTKIPFKSCGDNIDIIDNPIPITFSDTVGDTIYTYWKDTDCKREGLF